MNANLNTIASAIARGQRVALDTETYDPDLKSKGPGVRRDGYIVGISLAVEDLSKPGGKGPAWYLPIRHEAGGNRNPELVLRMLRNWAKNYSGELVGANLIYDLDYLAEADVTFDSRPKFLDIQLAEPLLDEDRPMGYSLDELGGAYLGHGKNMDELIAALDKLKTGYNANSPVGSLWRVPGPAAEVYALGDVYDPLQILRRQEKKLSEEKLDEVWDLETRLVPLMLAMRRRGVRVDLRAAQKARAGLVKKRTELIKKLEWRAGHEVKIWGANSVAKLLEDAGLDLPRTPVTNQPSVTKLVLERAADFCEPAAELLAARRYDKTIGTFIDGIILKGNIKGWVYPLIHQLKADEGGTVSGRFSYAMPNLQQIPARDPEITQLIRGIFKAATGSSWVSTDYSQVEFRLLTHYARGDGAVEARARYNEDANTSFHKMAAELAGMDADDPSTYKRVKNTNFCKVFGGGAKKVAETAGISLDDAKEFVKLYEEKLPFVKKTSRWVDQVANRRGYIRSLSGRRHRFPKWEPADWYLARLLFPPSPHREVVAQDVMRQIEIIHRKGAEYVFGDTSGLDYPLPKNYTPRSGTKRAYTWRALNRLLQGGNADILKKTMIGFWEAGLDDALPMILTVHDEFGNSKAPGPRAQEALRELIAIAESAHQLTVPLVVSIRTGRSWGACADVQ